MALNIDNNSVRAAFARSGYPCIDIHNDGKLVRIYDTEICEYIATANYRAGGYDIWPVDVEYIDSPDTIGRVELN